MSGMATYTPGMEISGGSLGQGLPIAVGMALGLRQKGNPAFVYNCMSDGELDEGSTWEAAMSAQPLQLDNLITLVDINNQQADGPSTKVLGFEPLVDKWAAFGWHVQRVDGNDLPAVLAAFDKARNLAQPQPRVILFDTKMGKGVPFLEAREKNHFMRVGRRRVAARDRTAGCRASGEELNHEHRRRRKPRLKTSAMIASIAGEGQRTRPAPFGNALVELARRGPKSSA